MSTNVIFGEESKKLLLDLPIDERRAMIDAIVIEAFPELLSFALVVAMKPGSKDHDLAVEQTRKGLEEELGDKAPDFETLKQSMTGADLVTCGFGGQHFDTYRILMIIAQTYYEQNRAAIELAERVRGMIHRPQGSA